MKYRPLGNSGMEVSVLSFGAWQIGDQKYWGEHDAKDGEAAVNAAIDAGINFFDTAEMYGGGESEVQLGKYLGRHRSSVYVASKFWPDHAGRDSLRTACEASLKRLGTDYLDLYQVHWASRTVPFAETFGEMDRLRQDGKVRHIGVSNFGVKDLEEWMGMGDAVSNQLGYNLLFRTIETEIVPACARRRLGVLAYMPLMQGLLSGRYASAGEIPALRRRTRHFSGSREGTRHGEAGAEELTFHAIQRIREVAGAAGTDMATLSLAWVLAQPGITSAIVGARNASQLKRNLLAIELDISPETASALDKETAALSAHFADNADMWDSSENSRIR